MNKRHISMKEFKILIQGIVTDAKKLNAKHTNQWQARVNYTCIFSQSQAEYEELVNLAKQLGNVVQDTEMGPIFFIAPLLTDSGILRLLKIRKPDPKRPERGDADFTIVDYDNFKRMYLGRLGFSLIQRTNIEMLELMDPSFNVLAYYSHPILADVLNLDRTEK